MTALRCSREDCPHTLMNRWDVVCVGDFTALAGACRGKKRLGQPEADLVAARYRRHAYRCPLCRQWHNGGRPRLHEQLDLILTGTVAALRDDERCGPAGILSLIEAWDPARVNRESWHEGLDQREAHAVPCG